MKRICVVLVSIGFSLMCKPTFAAGGETSAYQQGVNAYLKDDYKAALPHFKDAEKADSKNPKVHYYLALCYQQTDDDKNAAAEYELALSNSKDAAFKEIVAERLLRTKRRLGTAPKATSEESAPKLAKHQPVQKVIWFSTNWCSHCKKFSSAWEDAKTKFNGKLSFEHLNAEDPSAWKEVQVYRPKAYPTLVYLDAKNKIIENFAAAPSSEEFIKHLEDLGAKSTGAK